MASTKTPLVGEKPLSKIVARKKLLFRREETLSRTRIIKGGISLMKTNWIKEENRRETGQRGEYTYLGNIIKDKTY